jgi:hypothetical protein
MLVFETQVAKLIVETQPQAATLVESAVCSARMFSIF